MEKFAVIHQFQKSQVVVLKMSEHGKKFVRFMADAPDDDANIEINVGSGAGTNQLFERMQDGKEVESFLTSSCGEEFVKESIGLFVE